MKLEISNDGKWSQSLTVKIVLLALMGFFLLIPLELIKSVIKERQLTSENVKKEIALQWAGQQTVSGPVLNIPVKIYPAKKDEEPHKTIFHLMPETLNISGNVETEKRHRSIYQAVVYIADLDFSGDFSVPEFNTGEKSEILWDEAYYTLGISDNRGIKGSVTLKTDSLGTDAIPGLKDSEVFNSGITFPAELSKDMHKVTYSLHLELSGSEGLNFCPLGKTTRTNLKSRWPAPGFHGNFLPSDRVINDTGFSAEWLVTNLNRNFPQSWYGNAFNTSPDSFGVEFVLLVDHYQKSLRSAKYGILFIALTFMALIFVELAFHERFHIFNYLLLAFALILFFSLLNAVSEQVGFNIAYLIAAFATISLISLFLRKIVKNNRSLLILSGLLVLLYSFIFILLSLNDYAYLAGNIGLFIILFILMMISSKFHLFNSGQTEEKAD